MFSLKSHGGIPATLGAGGGQWPDTEITAGDSCTIDGLSGGGTVRVTWESEDGSNTGTLATYDYDV